MNVAIRVDASSQIGTGHFMRCLTLADALKQHVARVRFISRFLPQYLRAMLSARKYEFILLDDAPHQDIEADLLHSPWLGTSQHSDAQESIRALSDQTWDWLIVDHYALDDRWESPLRHSAKHILAIDDLADRQHDCDMLLDQNFYSDMESRYAGKVPSHCRLLLGPRYALLRDEFRLWRDKVKPRSGPIKRVLVFFGGVDADNYTGCTIEALSDLDLETVQVDVVIGQQHPYRTQIESTCTKHRFNCHVQTDRMAELMATADLAIGAGGTATWERCSLGLPAFIIATAENQLRQVADAASDGLVYAAQLTGDLRQAIKRHLEALRENSYLRHAISSKAMHVVDARGAVRVNIEMGCSGIQVVTARSEDRQRLFEWRNHPSIRAVSRDPWELDWEDHKKWFATLLSSPDRVLLIGERAGIAMGVVRFDIHNDEAEISIYVVPGITEVGVGRGLLQAAENWLLAQRPEIGRIRAQVLASNQRSHRLFTGAGYQQEFASYSKRLH
jgi:UDP-2,4-diacetamido-2,4,6-trideoxy-beta-L-altropyranose hydrolase